MNQYKKNIRLLIMGAVAGAVIAALLTVLLVNSGSRGPDETAQGGEKEPLYWVAPMDPNYRRDKPGKSPMGMDLLPVYAEEGGGLDAGPGTIRISPEVVNNLGVRTVTAERKALQREIAAVGYVDYDEDRLLRINPRVEGWIERLHVKAAGDPVAEGQPLYDIYSPALVNAQEELILALGRDNSRLLRAAEDRLKSLRIPSQTIEKLKRDKQVRQTVTIYAPRSGVLDDLAIREGSFVTPGMTLMTIGVLDQVWVQVDIPERQAFQVTAGLPVDMTLDYAPTQSWRGRVDYIYPALDPQTRTVRARLRFMNEDRALKPGMFARVTIHAESADDTLLVPRQAVIRTGRTDRVVLALGKGSFKSIEVTTGRFDPDHMEITSGLHAGDEIVAAAQFLLDSESSKTSDFKRMDPGGRENMEDMVPTADEARPEKVWVTATLNSLMTDDRMLNVTHAPIAEWDWPEMTMNFTVAEGVSVAALEEGMTLHMEIGQGEDNQYVITDTRIPDDMPGTDAEPEPMDHEHMDHSNH